MAYKIKRIKIKRGKIYKYDDDFEGFRLVDKLKVLEEPKKLKKKILVYSPKLRANILVFKGRLKK